MQITVKEFFNSHNITLKDKSYVMCVHNGYQPHFHKGRFYDVVDETIQSNAYNILRMDSHQFNKLFVPLEGKPTSMSMRDKLMTIIRNPQEDED